MIGAMVAPLRAPGLESLRAPGLESIRAPEFRSPWMPGSRLPRVPGPDSPRASGPGSLRASAFRALRMLALVAAWALLPDPARAIDPVPPFDDPRLEAEYQALIREVRCLVCQNQTIADSNAPLAADLRREIREMMGEGASRADVVEFLVARYGDFVLYRPRFQPSTWVLWGAPGVFVVLGAVVFARVLRKRLTGPLDGQEPP